MSDDLNVRAARAMGDKFRTSEAEYGLWLPTTDANACRELLQEVERRGTKTQLIFTERLHEIYHEESVGDIFYPVWLLTAPLETIVKAAVEVLESE